MNSATAAQLLNINRRFYLEHGKDFADTRERIQPGVRRVVQGLRREDTILDLGCGSGALARTLSQNGHEGSYVGVDFSPAALERARLGHYGFPTAFLEAALESPDELHAHVESRPEGGKGWAVVLAFAVLHHIPTSGLRIQLLRQVRGWVRGDGRLALSNWQFSTNGRMLSRILPWPTAGLKDADVEEGDYLVDWRRGGAAVRYVHEFRQSELEALAAESGFRVVESFLSDGLDGQSGLYQMWMRV